MMKEFYIQVKLEYSMSTEAETEAQAREIIKDIFKEQHNIYLKDNEIISDFSEEETL